MLIANTKRDTHELRIVCYADNTVIISEDEHTKISA